MKKQKPLALGEASRQAKPLLHTPFPGMIDDQRWSVKQGRWPVFIERDPEGGGVMHVPLSGEQVDRKLRLHEEAHVAWTPPVSEEDVNSWGVDTRTINACEDGRIINLMGRTSPDWRSVNERVSVLTEQQKQGHAQWFGSLLKKLSGEQEPPEMAMGPEPTLIEAARMLASSRGYYEEQTFNDLARNLPFIAEAVNDMHRRHIKEKDPPTFDDTVAYAKELERHFAEVEKQMLGDAQLLRDANMPHSPEHIDDTDDDYAWGEMEIERVPLPERLRSNPSRRTRAADTGVVPRYMHRLVSDQRVFGRKRSEKAFQGTVLIDHSGSMSLSVSEVDEILSRWPAVTIASYSGDYDGTLRIIAEKGRRAGRVHLSAPGGGGNCVDGPALDWLAKQRGPRIWISDGIVSGQGEDFRMWFSRDAARKVVAGRIKRIENVRSLLGT